MYLHILCIWSWTFAKCYDRMGLTFCKFITFGTNCLILFELPSSKFGTSRKVGCVTFISWWEKYFSFWSLLKIMLLQPFNYPLQLFGKKFPDKCDKKKKSHLDEHILIHLGETQFILISSFLTVKMKNHCKNQDT